MIVADSLNGFVTSTPDSVDVQIADGDINNDVDFGVEEGPNLVSILGPLFGPQLSNEVSFAAFFAAIKNFENVESFGRWTFIDTGSRRLAFYTEATESSNGTAYSPLVSIGNVAGGGILGGGIPGVELTDGDGGGTVEDNVRLIGSMPLGLPDAVAVPFAEMALRGRPEENLGNPWDGIPGGEF